MSAAFQDKQWGIGDFRNLHEQSLASATAISARGFPASARRLPTHTVELLATCGDRATNVWAKALAIVSPGSTTKRTPLEGCPIPPVI